jgi:nucleotide-binding universal stress UspA family protein
VKESDPLAVGTGDIKNAKKLFEIAENMFDEPEINVRSVVTVAHRISEGIVHTAEEEECNFIIVGREKNPAFLERFFSSIIDSVMQRFAGEIAVLHGSFNKEEIKTILIPFRADIHAILATEIAPAFLEYFKCRIKLLLVYEPDTPRLEKEKREHKVKEIIAENNIPAEVQILHNSDILTGIVEQSKKADMILMGGRTGDFLELLFGRSLAVEITEQSACPVIWVKEFEERESFWQLLLKPLKETGVENG